MIARSFSPVRIAALLAAGVVALSTTAPARITKSRSTPSAVVDVPNDTPWYLTPFYSILVGGGFEYQTDRDQTEYGFPLLIEYNFSEKLTLTLEPIYTVIDGKSPDIPSLRGFGDLDTTLDYELLRERRYRPAIGLEAAIRWPTAENPDLGSPGHDYTLGLIASKDLVFMDIDFNVLYTTIGGRGLADTVEISLATSWRINRELALIAEVADVHHLGTLAGEQRDETEATLGLAWQVSHFLKLEQGIVFKEAGNWEAIFAWEWSFGGD